MYARRHGRPQRAAASPGPASTAGEDNSSLQRLIEVDAGQSGAGWEGRNPYAADSGSHASKASAGRSNPTSGGTLFGPDRARAGSGVDTVTAGDLSRGQMLAGLADGRAPVDSALADKQAAAATNPLGRGSVGAPSGSEQLGGTLGAFEAWRSSQKPSTSRSSAQSEETVWDRGFRPGSSKNVTTFSERASQTWKDWGERWDSNTLSGGSIWAGIKKTLGGEAAYTADTRPGILGTRAEENPMAEGVPAQVDPARLRKAEKDRHGQVSMPGEGRAAPELVMMAPGQGIRDTLSARQSTLIQPAGGEQGGGLGPSSGDGAPSADPWSSTTQPPSTNGGEREGQPGKKPGDPG